MADEAPTTWTTTEAVRNLTGVAVDQATLVQAQGVIELRTGVLLDQPKSLSLGARDTAFLARAIGYQAAWMDEHPDLFSRMAVDSASQEGQSMSGKANYMTLAPLARAAIKRLSWKGTRSTTHERATEAAALDDDDLDGLGRPLPWVPLS